MRTRIGDLSRQKSSKLRDNLQSAHYVCLTADGWKTNTRGYLGVTAHWLTDSLQRQSGTLALRRFRGSHTYDRIASMLANIMEEYALSPEKTVNCVTDNASNFVKAFKEFGVEIDEDECEAASGGSDDEDDTGENDDVSVADILDSNNSEGSGSQLIALPPHLRCACHLINLIAKDAHKVFTSSFYSINFIENYYQGIPLMHSPCAFVAQWWPHTRFQQRKAQCFKGHWKVLQIVEHMQPLDTYF